MASGDQSVALGKHGVDSTGMGLRSLPEVLSAPRDDVSTISSSECRLTDTCLTKDRFSGGLAPSNAFRTLDFAILEGEEGHFLDAGGNYGV